MNLFYCTESRTEETKSRGRERQSNQLGYYKEHGCDVHPQGSSLAGRACDPVPRAPLPPPTVREAGLGLVGVLVSKPVPLTHQLAFLPQKSHPTSLAFGRVQTPIFPGNMFDP